MHRYPLFFPVLTIDRFPVWKGYRNLPGRTILFVLLMGCPLPVFGQGLRLLGIPLDTLFKTSMPRVDQAYVTTYYRRLHLFVVSDRQDYAMHVVGTPASLTYKPNLAWNLGVGIDYRWLGTELTIKLPFLGYNTVHGEKTKTFGATFNFNNRRFWFSAQYQFYRGFYIRNPELLEADWFDHNTAYPYRNDMRSQTVMGHALYMFRPLQLSVPATLLQREAQRKNAGSWVVGGFLNYQYIRGDSSLVPTVLQSDFRPESRLLRVTSVTLGIDVGYMQTFIFRKHYFTSLSLRPGLALLYQQSTTVTNPSATHFQIGWQGTAAVTLGYTSDVFYGGLYGSSTLINRVFSGSLINTNAEYVRLVFGKRIRYRPKGIIRQVPGMKSAI